MKLSKLILSASLLFLVMSCQTRNTLQTEPQVQIKGKLFIIGGGKRPVNMIDRLIAEAGVRDSGYVLILPLASGEVDSAIYYSSKQFSEQGIGSISFISASSIDSDPGSVIDLIQHASLIYISGGDQNRFMDLIEGTPIRETIIKAYLNGATVAGTSAGAAVMSEKMITGNEIKHPVYTGKFPTIEANNVELGRGLGLLDQAIIDQHFLKRQRWNRLISVCLENPESICLGIDESTAILVKDGVAEVLGENQVIAVKHTRAETKIVNGLLGGENLDLSIYLPGDTINF